MTRALVWLGAWLLTAAVTIVLSVGAGLVVGNAVVMWRW